MKRNSSLLSSNDRLPVLRRGDVVMVFLLLTVVGSMVSGCATARAARYQKEVAMPMLIQENRQLEDELFYLREQLSRCCFDNQQLQQQVTTLQAKVDAISPSTSSRSRSQNTRQERSTATVPAWSPTR